MAVKADVEKRVHPHGLRHTLAYELMMEGVPLMSENRIDVAEVTRRAGDSS